MILNVQFTAAILFTFLAMSTFRLICTRLLLFLLFCVTLLNAVLGTAIRSLAVARATRFNGLLDFVEFVDDIVGQMTDLVAQRKIASRLLR